MKTIIVLILLVVSVTCYSQGGIIIGNATAADTNNLVANGSFSGNGTSLTALNASQLTSGTVPIAAIPNTIVSNSATFGTSTGITNHGAIWNDGGFTNAGPVQLGGATSIKISAAAVISGVTSISFGSSSAIDSAGTFRASTATGSGFVYTGAGLLTPAFIVSPATGYATNYLQLTKPGSSAVLWGFNSNGIACGDGSGLTNSVGSNQAGQTNVALVAATSFTITLGTGFASTNWIPTLVEAGGLPIPGLTGLTVISTNQFTSAMSAFTFTGKLWFTGTAMTQNQNQ